MPEYLLSLCVLASVMSCVVVLVTRGYLPQPFIFDTNDTFMDWFNPGYWANNPGAYEVWRSVYPPLSFVFLRIFSLSSCYLESSFHARDCDWVGRATIIACYLIVVVLAFRAFRARDIATSLPRAIAFGLGFPLLYTLERGNLIIVCLIFYIIAYGDVVKSRAARLISIAITINFKPYLLLLSVPFAIRRDWRSLELAAIATLGLYLLTLAWLGAGTVGELAQNTAVWVQFQGGQIWNEIYFSTSFSPFLLIEANHFPILTYVPSRTFETMTTVVPFVVRGSQLVALLCLVGAWLQPGALTNARISAVILAAYLVTQSPGGYTIVFLCFLVFLEDWRRAGPVIALICAYILSLSADWMIASVQDMNANSWLGGRPVSVSFGLSAGQFVRPALVVMIVWALALDGLMLIVRAHRDHRPNLGLTALASSGKPAWT